MVSFIPSTLASVSRKVTKDVKIDSQYNPRSLGVLEKNTSALTVRSALIKNDTADFFSFTVTGSPDNVALKLKTENGRVRVQVTDVLGNIFADSEALAGSTAAENYQKLTQGTATIAEGQYTIQVTRAAGESYTKKPRYALEISAGTYENYYDTVEKPADQINLSQNAKKKIIRNGTIDVVDDSAKTARNVGLLENNTSRITVLGGLAKGDDADFFSFNVKGNPDNVQLFGNPQPDNTSVRVQILDSTGSKVIADSAASKYSDEHSNYRDIVDGNLALKDGSYRIKVSRAPGASKDSTPTYSLQLTAGAYSTDYDTTERANNIIDRTPVASTRVMNKTTADVVNDSAQAARDIGVLQKDKTRLTLFSAMTASDRVDFFSFKVKGNPENISLGLQEQDSTGKLRIQILDKSGRKVIADSEGGQSSDVLANYQAAQAGKLSLKDGDYKIKVTRGSAGVLATKQTYAIILSAGAYDTTYDTKETPFSRQKTSSTQGSDVSNFVGSKPPDGKTPYSAFGSIGNIFDFLS